MYFAEFKTYTSLKAALNKTYTFGGVSLTTSSGGNYFSINHNATIYAMDMGSSATVGLSNMTVSSYTSGSSLYVTNDDARYFIKLT